MSAFITWWEKSVLSINTIQEIFTSILDTVVLQYIDVNLGILTLSPFQFEDCSCWSIQPAAISGDAGSRQQPSVYTEPVSFGWPGQLAGNTVSWVYSQTESQIKKSGRISLMWKMIRSGPYMGHF